MNIGNFITDWFNFKKMLTPVIIKVIYILSNLFIVLYSVIVLLLGVYALFSQDNVGAGIISFLAMAIVAALSFIFGVLMVRLLCEFIIVIFSIHESLAIIEKKLSPDKKKE